MTKFNQLIELMFKFKNFILSIFSSNFTHIYIDESFCIKSGLATLTAIFIPQKKLGSISADFYKVINQIIDKYPNKINDSKLIYSAPVLHGNSLLRKKNEKDIENKGWDFSIIDDDFRIETFNNIIDIVLKHRIRIVRLGYNNYDELKRKNYKDEQMYNLIWIGLSSYIDRSYRIKKAICIMEGNSSGMISAFSTFLSGAKMFSYVYPDVEKSSVFSDSKKFIGNVFYVPARYCEYLQIVDIISYILHKKDFVDITNESSDFSKKIYHLSRRLNDNLDINKLYRLNTSYIPKRKQAKIKKDKSN